MKNANCDPEKIERTIQQRRDTWEENNSRVDKIVKTKKGKKGTDLPLLNRYKKFYVDFTIPFI